MNKQIIENIHYKIKIEEIETIHYQMSPLAHRMPKAFMLELSIASDLSTIFMTNSRKDATLLITAKSA